MSYQPPYTITAEIIRLISAISEKLGRLSVDVETGHLRLRRINRIRTIQGSLAIEGNTLSETQITAILDGKTVIAPPREIQEVRNATLAYDQLAHWRPQSEDDLLAAHQCASITPQVAPHDTPQVKRLLTVLAAKAAPMNRDELQRAMGLKDRKSFRRVYLKPALDAQLIEMTIPDKPSSRLQQYVLTQRGKRRALK